MVDRTLCKVGGSDLTLPELFDLYFANNRKLERIISDGSGHTFWDYSNGSDNIPFRSDAMPILDREFSIGCVFWPVTLERYDLFVEWAEASVGVFRHLAPEERGGRLDHLKHQYEPEDLGTVALYQARLAARVVASRYKAMIKLLRSGELEAFGHSNSGSIEQISPAIWHSTKIRVNFNDNEIHMAEPAARPVVSDRHAPRQAEATRCLWFGVALRRSPLAQPSQEAPTAPPANAEPKNKGGRPSQYPWPEAIELLALSYGQYGAAQSGVELYERLAGIFEYLGKPPDDINLDTIRIEVGKIAPKIKEAALGKLQMKPLPKPESRRKPQKVR